MHRYGRAATSGSEAAAAAAGRRAVRDHGHRRQANRAVAVSAAGLAATGGVELAIALLTGSVGLLSDALHNLSDVSTSVVVAFGFWISKKAPTARYPYGYERAEDLAGLGVALVIWVSALLAGYESVRKLLSGAGTSNLALGMAAAGIGIAGNIAVSRYKLRVGRRIHSTALVADADHSRLDALASVGALAGLMLVALGFPVGDPIAGFAVTLLIVGVGVEVTRDVLHHLLDGIEPGLIDSITSVARRAPGVEDVTHARGRWTGRAVRVELDVRFAGDASAAAVAAAQAWIEDAARTEHEMVAEVRVSVRA